MFLPIRNQEDTSANYVIRYPSDLIKILRSRRATPNTFVQALRNADIEEALNIFDDAEHEMRIEGKSADLIEVKNGETILIECLVRAFPKPKFELNSKGNALEGTNQYDWARELYKFTYKKEVARYSIGPY